MSDGASYTDASLRRTLRFSMFLQAFAALMMGAAAVVRAVSLGWDLVTVLLGLAFALILGAMAFTWGKLKDATAG
jgi:hypothetical protein